MHYICFQSWQIISFDFSEVFFWCVLPFLRLLGNVYEKIKLKLWFLSHCKCDMSLKYFRKSNVVRLWGVVAYEAFGISRIPVDVHVLRFAKYFGWCRDNATASKCQEDIESWMPEINWYRVNSTIGSFCQLAGSNKELLYSEMDRMRIGLINPKFNMVHFLKDYVYWHENSR